MINWVPPGLVFIFGAALIPLLRGRARQAYLLILPVLAYLNLMNIPEGTGYIFRFLEYELVFTRADKLSKVFGYIFVIITFAGFMFSLHLKSSREHVIASIYAGSALGAVFAGDYITLFIFWELMAVAAAFIIWGSGTKESRGAGFRYMLVHIFGGLSLLAGIAMQITATGSTEFNWTGSNGIGAYLILLGFVINAAVPPLHAWLPDAYPEAPVTGAVYLTAFTTKTAVYVLARGFYGVEILMWAGAIMAVYGVTYAMLQSNMRRLLSYHIVSQVGFMVCGIGIGTEMALNGAVAHAFSHILYKALLFMSTGSVIYVTGKKLLSDLSGSELYKKMPVTLILYTIGAFSISGVPLLNGFISKSMTVYAAGMEKQGIIQLMLTFASVGTFLSVALKLCYFAWYGEKRQDRVAATAEAKEPPLNMLLGMGIAAFLCIFMGIYPSVLYNILPYDVEYHPYKAAKVAGTLGLLIWTAFGFMLLRKKLEPVSKISLDTDWFYRKGASAFMWVLNNPMAKFGAKIARVAFETIPSSLSWISKNPMAVLKIASDTVLLQFAVPEKREEIKQRIEMEKKIYPGDIIKHWPIGTVVLWVILFLLAYLLIYYLRH